MAILTVITACVCRLNSGFPLVVKLKLHFKNVATCKQIKVLGRFHFRCSVIRYVQHTCVFSFALFLRNRGQTGIWSEYLSLHIYTNIYCRLTEPWTLFSFIVFIGFFFLRDPPFSDPNLFQDMTNMRSTLK